MPENDQPGSDTNEAQVKNKHSFRGYALLEFLPIGLRVILLAGVILFIALAGISTFAPHMAERIKFFTTNFLSLVVLIAILVQAYINRRQWEAMDKQSDAMQGQLDAMRDTIAQNERVVAASETQAAASQAMVEHAREAFYLSERPYITLETISIYVDPDGQPPEAKMSFRNTGRTPASNVTMQAYLNVRDTPFPENPEYKPFDQPGSRAFIGAGGDFVIHAIFDEELPEGMVERIIANRLTVYAYGRVTYQDGLGIAHELKFCCRYMPDTGRVADHDVHNSST